MNTIWQLLIGCSCWLVKYGTQNVSFWDINIHLPSHHPLSLPSHHNSCITFWSLMELFYASRFVLYNTCAACKRITLCTTYTGNIEILANHTGKSYWRGKFWQISNSHIGAYAIYVFLWILARKILANGSRFAKFANFSPTENFLCTVFVFLFDLNILCVVYW